MSEHKPEPAMPEPGARVRIIGMAVSNGTETIDAIGFISRIYVENGRAPRFDVTLERAPYESDPTVRDLARNDFSVLPE